MMHLNMNPSFTDSAFTGFIGVAQADITPPPGIYARNWGASAYDTAEGVHRPLMLTCITFQSTLQEEPLILISADLGWWKNKDDEWLVRKGILEELSLDSSRLMFCLSHTHAGPSIYRDDAFKPGGELIEPYLLKVRNTAIQAAKSGLSRATPATLTWHYGKCNLAANRDLSVSDSKRILVGFNPEQPADDTLLVGRVTDKHDHDRIIATLVNYACHPTTLAWENRLISPDYVGAMREVVESYTAAPCLFLQGASGELAPAEQYVGEPDIADKHGFQLGYAVLSTLSSMLPPETLLSLDGIIESGAPLAVWKRKNYPSKTSLSASAIEVSLPLKPLPSLTEIEEQLNTCEDRALKERLWRLRGIRKSVGNGDSVQVPLWIWQLGDSFLIGQPNEAYSIFQKQLRSQVYPQAAAVMNIVNGSFGYLPPRDFYDKDIYPVWQTPFVEGSLELLIETALQAAGEKL
jgi:hypothetical protein